MPTWNLRVIISLRVASLFTIYTAHSGGIRKPNLLSIRCQKNKFFEIMPKVDLATPLHFTAAASPISLLNTTFFGLFSSGFGLPVIARQQPLNSWTHRWKGLLSVPSSEANWNMENYEIFPLLALPSLLLFRLTTETQTAKLLSTQFLKAD